MKIYHWSIVTISTSLLVSACSSSPTQKNESASKIGHGLSSVSSATLEKYAPTKLDASLSQKIQQMMDVRSTGAGISTPDGKRLVFSWRITGVPQVWRLDGPQKFPIQLTGGEDATQVLAISRDGKKIIISRDRNGEENPGIYWQSIEGGPSHVIQHKPGIQSEFSVLSKDSKTVYFRSNDIKSDSYAIYRYNIEDQKRELLYEGQGNWYIDDLSSDEKRLLLGKSITNIASEHYELDLQSKKLTPIIGQGEVEDYSVSFAKHAGEYLVATPKMGEFRQLYLYKNKKLNLLSKNAPHDVTGFSTDVDQLHVFYATNENGYTRTHVLDAATLREISMPTIPGVKNAEHINVRTSGPTGRFTSAIVGTHNAPNLVYVIDWNTRAVKQWLLPSSPEVDTSGFAKATLEYYPARDGTKIPMFVRRPKNCEIGCPVVVHFHGGPEGQSTPGFSTYAQMLIDSGFVFVEPNVRGSEGYGKTWLHSDDKAKRLNVITDIEDCSRFIKEKWAKNGVTPKVGVMGWSYGGYSTLVAMTMFAGAYDAGVAMVGMSNLLTFLNNTAPYRRALRTPEYGDPVVDHDALVKLSPMTYLDRIKAPLLIIQGATDPRVPVSESVQMQEALAKKHIPSQLIIFSDEGHGAQKRSNKVLEFGNLLGFFEKHLK